MLFVFQLQFLDLVFEMRDVRLVFRVLLIERSHVFLAEVEGLLKLLVVSFLFLDFGLELSMFPRFLLVHLLIIRLLLHELLHALQLTLYVLEMGSVADSRPSFHLVLTLEPVF